MEKKQFLNAIDCFCRDNAEKSGDIPLYSNPMFIHRRSEVINSFEDAARAFSKVHGITIPACNVKFAFPKAVNRINCDSWYDGQPAFLYLVENYGWLCAQKGTYNIWFLEKSDFDIVNPCGPYGWKYLSCTSSGFCRFAVFFKCLLLAAFLTLLIILLLNF